MLKINRYNKSDIISLQMSQNTSVWKYTYVYAVKYERVMDIFTYSLQQSE